MADKKVTPPLGAYPQPQPPQGPFLPAPPQHAAPQYSGHGMVPGGLPTALPGGGYGVSLPGGVGGVGGMGGVGGVGGVYPPPYDQLQHHQLPLGHQLPQMYSPAAAMYAASYPGYFGYPVQYYPYYQSVQPSIQPLRPTIMIPNGFEGGARYEGLGQPLVGGGVPPPHLSVAPHQVLWR